MARKSRTVTFNLDSSDVGVGDQNSGIGRESNVSGDNSAVAGTVIEPSAVIGDAGTASGNENSNNPGGRKPRSDRGKKRGPRTAKEDKIDITVFSETISEIHSMLAYFTGIPEMALDEKSGEHEKLGRAISRVARHYDMPNIDPVKYDWFMLFKTMVLIYGSKWMIYNSKNKGKKQDNVTSGQAQGSDKPATQAVNKSPKPAQNNPGVRSVTIPGFENMGPVIVPLN